MEVLCDIGRGIVDADGLSLANLTASELTVAAESFDEAGCVLFLVNVEIQVSTGGFDLGEKRRMSELFQDLTRDERRGLAVDFGQFKAGKRVVSHILPRRDLDHLRDLLAGELGNL